MKKTFVKELTEVDLQDPILVEGLPGLGLVGKICIRYLTKKLKAKRLAHLYSPHFPYFVLVNKKGSVRLLRGTFYFWKRGGGKDLVFFTGDSQAQTIEGQYEISDCILNFAKQKSVKMIVTVGGYRMEAEGKPKVVASANNEKLLRKALEAKAVLSSMGSPIVGTAGLILGLARFSRIGALCLLGETRGYLPDPKASKSVLEVLKTMLGLEVDLHDLDEEIEKADQMIARLQKIEADRALQTEDMRREQDKRIRYIS